MLTDYLNRGVCPPETVVFFSKSWILEAYDGRTCYDYNGDQ